MTTSMDTMVITESDVFSTIARPPRCPLKIRRCVQLKITREQDAESIIQELHTFEASHATLKESVSECMERITALGNGPATARG